MTHKRLTLFAGHYGSGKTNIALNYARWLRRQGEAVIVADLDIVNPYFRTKDSEEDLKKVYTYIELNFGKTYLSPLEEKKINFQLCRGIHAD